MKEKTNSITHLIGLMLSIAGMIILIISAPDSWHIVGFSIFGTSLILLYTASTLYHSIKKKFLLKLDYAMIYILIAGTYTPLCLTTLRGPWGWSIFGIIWGLAITGILIKVLTKIKGGLISTIFYILMGWLIIIALPVLIKAGISLTWLITGGILYTLGTPFYILSNYKKTPWSHEIFHLFVLAGSTAHFLFFLTTATT